MSDGPFYKIADEMENLLATAEPPGSVNCWVRWTCRGCGARQTFDVPNTLYMEGRCEECDHITNLVEHGCGFTLMKSATAELAEELKQITLGVMAIPREERQ